MKCLKIEPGKSPETIDIEPALETLQNLVGGYIECVYPFEEDVCLIVNEEGKILNLPLNRALRDEDGALIDIIAGTFLVVAFNDDTFADLTDKQVEHYSHLYRYPEIFVSIDGQITALPAKELVN